MKTEDDPSSSDFIASVPSADSAATSCANTPSTLADDPELISASPQSPTKRSSKKRSDGTRAHHHAKEKDKKVCDLCRERRIRCDYQTPCRKCIDANIVCRRDYVPQKRGPKPGNGRVLNAIRKRDTQKAQDAYSHPTTISAPPEPRSAFTSDQYQPLHRPYLELIPRCVDLYYEHIYPIMPLLYIPAIRAMVRRQLTDSEKNLTYALCAMVCLHMSGKSLHVDGPESWEEAGRFFLDQCVSTRNQYDYLEDNSLENVISSFWLSTSFFEINQNKKSWVYLREALTFAEDMGLHDNSTYAGLSPTETLCRQRVFWILFVTERSFAILRKRPITFKKTPSLPTTRHVYESPDIHTGFLQLVSQYTPLDESFVSAWNDGSDPRVSAATYLALQNVLANPPAFLQQSRASTPSSDSNTTYSAPVTAAPSLTGSDEEADEEIVLSEPTAIQKADLLITQQWLRLIVWQSSSKQKLLSWNAQHESMTVAFPLEIARATANVLQSLPSSAVEVHGMGMFEKIFEIGNCAMNVLDMMDQSSGARSSFGSMGMDFVGSGDLGVLGLSRRGVATDPFEVFVRTLSATPNSRSQFANTLLATAQQRPGVMKMALTPALTAPALQPENVPWSTDLSSVSNSLPMNSMIDGVVKEETDMDTEGDNGWSLGNNLSLDSSASAPPLLSDSAFDFNSPPFATTSSNPPNNTRQQALTSYSIPSLDTSLQTASTWVDDMNAASQDWSFDLTSPTLDTPTFSNNLSAYSSGAGTPLGNFTPSIFSRQDSGNSVTYPFQQRQPPFYAATYTGGASTNKDFERERARRAQRFVGNLK